MVGSLALDEGTYRWAVYALRDKRDAPIFLKWRQVTLHKQAGPKVHVQVEWTQPRQ